MKKKIGKPPQRHLNIDVANNPLNVIRFDSSYRTP